MVPYLRERGVRTCAEALDCVAAAIAAAVDCVAAALAIATTAAVSACAAVAAIFAIGSMQSTSNMKAQMAGLQSEIDAKTATIAQLRGEVDPSAPGSAHSSTVWLYGCMIASKHVLPGQKGILSLSVLEHAACSCTRTAASAGMRVA